MEPLRMFAPTLLITVALIWLLVTARSAEAAHAIKPAARSATAAPLRTRHANPSVEDGTCVAGSPALVTLWPYAPDATDVIIGADRW
jgi:hypothetical protein